MRVGRTFWQEDDYEVEDGEGEVVHILDIFIERGFRIMMMYTEAYLCPCREHCSMLVEVDERTVSHWRNMFGLGGREFSSHR